MDIFGKVMSLLFNMLFRFVIAFLSRSKHLLNSWLQSPSGVILESKKLKSVTVSIVFPSICHEVMGPDAMILVFWILSFKPAFSLSSFTFCHKRLCHLHIWGYWYFPLQSWFQLVLHPVPYLPGIIHSFIPWNIHHFTISTSKSLPSPHWASAVLWIEYIL